MILFEYLELVPTHQFNFHFRNVVKSHGGHTETLTGDQRIDKARFQAEPGSLFFPHSTGGHSKPSKIPKIRLIPNRETVTFTFHFRVTFAVMKVQLEMRFFLFIAV